jgi:hypothetical protein
MAGIVIKNFRGLTPMLNPQLLPDGFATRASNARLTHGDLRSWNAPNQIVTLTKVGPKKTLYRFGEEHDETGYWFSWTTDVDVFRLPIDGDVSERTVWTGDGYPKITDNALALTGGTAYPMNSYRLGVPVPDASTVLHVITGAPTDDKDSFIDAAYVFTYVTGWGEESMPSDPVGPWSFKPGQTLTLNTLPGAPNGPYNVTLLRVYRTNTGDTGTTYQLHSELPIGTATLNDTKLQEALGEACPTFGWEMPPEDGFGFTLGANGNAIMLKDKTIYPCVPFVFYAFPAEYQLSTESKLVGAGAFGQSFAILTESNPYIVNGIDPANYSMTRIDTAVSCVSKRSIVEMLGGVIFASPDGLWIVNNDGLKPLTQSMFTKDQWQALNPSSIHAYQLDGRYYAFYDTGTKRGCMVFDFARSPEDYVELDQWCDTAFNDPLRDELYLSVDNDILKFDAGAALSYIWRTKEYKVRTNISYAYGRVDAEAYPVTFRLIADGAQVFEKQVQSSQPFRLPHKPAYKVAFELEGSSQVNTVAIAESAAEIKQV